MSDGKLEIALQLSAIDKMSGVINRAFSKAEAGFRSLAQKANVVSESAAKVGRSTALVGAAIAAPLVFATQKAMDFEEAMADVAKVSNLDRTSRAFHTLSQEALTLSKYLGKGANEVGGLYASLLSNGTALNELSKVSRIAGEAAVAFDMTQTAAGDAFMVMKNAMNLSVDQTKKAFDATNAITNSFGGKASDILDFMSKGGASVARTFKSTAPEMQAFGRALMMSGVSASEAGTVMTRFRVGLYKNAEAMRLFQLAGGGAGGMAAVFEAAQKSGDAFKWFQAHKFGEYSSQMALLSGNGKQLGEMLRFVSRESNYAGSAAQEFNNRMSTTRAQLDKAKEGFNAAAISAGNALLPVLTDLLKALTPVIENVSLWIQQNPGLTAQIMKAAAGAAGLAFAASGVSFAVSGLAKSVSLVTGALNAPVKVIKLLTDYKKGLGMQIFRVQYRFLQLSEFFSGKLVPLFRSGFSVIGKAVMALGRIMLANPILLIIAAIAAAAYLIYKNWDKVKHWFGNLWEGIKSLFSKAWNFIKHLFLNYTITGQIIRNWDRIRVFFTGLWQRVRERFTFFLDFIKGLPYKMFVAGKNIVTSIWEGIRAFAAKPVEAIKDIVSKIRNFLPFSPAREGALRDIHRIRLVETIADTLKPGPLVKAMRTTTAAAMIAVTPMAAKTLPKANARTGGTGGLNYSPTIHINGGGPGAEANFRKILQEHSRDIFRIVKDQERKDQRTDF
jgi:TP901 family phage tail tape measure protein